MRDRIIPRSVWPPKCHRVTAWHKDEHITQLLRAEDALAKTFGLRRLQDALSDHVILQLVDEALAGDSVYRVTAAMDLLFDAHESYEEILDAFAERARQVGRKSLRRLRCCFAFLRLEENHRDILGKHHAEITADCQHFKALARKAEIIARSVEAG